MSGVQRFDIGAGIYTGAMLARAGGDYVEWKDFATLQAERDALKAQVASEAKRLQAVIERDRTKVADIVMGMHREIAGRQNLCEGRGSYEWDDDRYRQEFGAALEALRGALTRLAPIAADWSDSPKTDAEVQAARATPPAPAASDNGSKP